MRVPNSWRFAYPSEIIEFFSGFAFKSEDAQDHGIRWLKIANVGVGKIKWDEESFLPVEYAKEHKRYMLNVGDIVVAMTRPTLGNYLKIARIEKEEERSLLNQRVAKIVIKDGGDPNFIFQLFRTENIAYRINTALLGTDPPNLSISVLKDFKVGIPPLQEQQKIAQILSTWDKAIEKLEALIAAKQKRKKALMQQLLTGKKRFAGFVGEWKIFSLSKICELGAGQSAPQEEKYFRNGSYEFLRVSDIGGSNRRWAPKSRDKVNDLAIKTFGLKSVPKRATLFTKSGASLLLNQRAQLEKETFVVSHLGYAIARKNICSDFLYFLLCEIDFKKYAAGTSLPALQLSTLANVKIAVPPSLEEQQKIASVLAAADKEIETQQKQLSTLKEQKKGLMQQLLTGKKRVKGEAA